MRPNKSARRSTTDAGNRRCGEVDVEDKVYSPSAYELALMAKSFIFTTEWKRELHSGKGPMVLLKDSEVRDLQDLPEYWKIENALSTGYSRFSETYIGETLEYSHALPEVLESGDLVMHKVFTIVTGPFLLVLIGNSAAMKTSLVTEEHYYVKR
jgi:hypothetical protein